MRGTITGSLKEGIDTMRDRMCTQIWFVDDKHANHDTWRRSFPAALAASCELRSFFSVGQIIIEFEKANIPDILFIDFFIDGRLGTEVIKWFTGKPIRPVLIAHSSMNEANQGMVREGADFYLEKIKNVPQTESIQAAFQTADDVASIIQTRTITRTHLNP